MFKGHNHIIKTTNGLLVTAAILFCVLFGQGAHLHDLDIHIGSQLDVHAHVHAHESHGEHTQAENNRENDNHRHEVNTSDDIIGTLTSSIQVDPDIQSSIAIGFDAGSDAFKITLRQSPTLYDLPPPRPAGNQYHLSSFSLRGPPAA
ncbi:hypothetical protein G3570_00475 [Balneolaceae bacterium YR4-1]|uniref:Uncharacterized protein n=1 Tax=Halalkalibaculum roseum TaxID=2709311 RepID=A0A6M1SJ97_9BACT|nr:hypothetical protein [Halalkalibaculum roseum]NGP75089.1 hypothetical protein [Halalkalibaculum roseum]